MSAFTNTVAGRDADASERFESLDPTTGEMGATILRCDAAAVNAAVEEADRAFKGEWRRASASERGRLLSRLADLIDRDTERLAQVETRDNGKLIAETRVQVAYMAKYFHYFGGLVDKIEGRQLPIDKPDIFVFTRREPLGVIAAITPWNSPLQLLS